jgi:two-component system NarL family sensor kinase
MENETLILLSVIFGTFFTFILIIIIIVLVVKYQKNKIEYEKLMLETLKIKENELIRAVVDTQESERQRIAMNLHDEINPLLVSLKWMIEHPTILKEEKDIRADENEKKQRIINEIIDNMHSVTKDLSPRILYKFGLERALKSILSEMNDLDCEFYSNNTSSHQIDESTALNIYRITLELIQNIRKHEKATTLKLNLTIENQLLKLRIEHNGVGISDTQFIQLVEKSSGLGLNSITSRLQLIGGAINFNTDNLASVEFNVPYKSEFN